MVDVTQDKALTGSGSLFATLARRSGTSHYQFNTRLNGNGSIQAFISKVVSGTETEIGARVTVPGGNYVTGDVLRMRFAVSGSSPATVQLKVWKVGTTEPADWTVTRTDTTAALAGAGGLGVRTYQYSTVTNAPVAMSFDNLSVTNP